MPKEKPSLPKGTRDFGPEIMKRRNFILQTISTIYKKYGFSQIETPSIENLSVLTGKYGEEGDQLLFKILNSGDFLKDVKEEDLKEGYQKLIPKISNKGLRYDLTVPLARFVVMNQNDITFPFKRFQIQNVWRADKPQKGRYREFLQCDADIIGTNSLLCEVEMVQMIDDVLNRLGIEDFVIRVNHREILSAIANSLGPAGIENEFAIIIDKLDKIGWEKVSAELSARGFKPDAIEKLHPLLTGQGDNETVIEILSSTMGKNSGIDDLREMLSMLKESGWNKDVLQLDPSLARGLAYYTGIIIEVVPKGINIGSIAGGGRYDNLTGVLGLPDIPATGFSFGIDRIYDVMNELNLFEERSLGRPTVLITHFDRKSFDYGLTISTRLRNEGITCELYPDLVKAKKQLSYANKKNINYVILIGEEELKSETLTLKNMSTGDQEKSSLGEIITKLNDG